MKDNTEAEHKTELTKAKLSQKEWMRVGRRWEYHEVASLMNDQDPLRALINWLKSKGFFVIDDPLESSEQMTQSSETIPDDAQAAVVSTSVNALGLEVQMHRNLVKALKTTALDQFEKFVEMFPVTLADEPPTKKMRISAGYKDRDVYDKWRGEQRKMHFNYILEQKALLEKDEKIIQAVAEQKWKGLQIKNFGGDKGKDTFGRRMNHSRKKSNVKPVHFQLKFPDGCRDTILFLASQDIKCNDELLWDYGVKKTSFRGEGIDLDWLDE
ncbi:uncharacterized protein AKAME5_000167900 [Lates japonicus]|uniref:SET domain-containing protein n=1 Tax=Lates japonicus TaxID=270547 RepID=A0AAD3M5I4_LATJO|nr:uncharacterized protein AKAME5_000167900 [Lates japonicus]